MTSQNEPIYEYVKGKGWVPAITQTYYGKDRDGVEIKIEYRKPDPNERFFYGYYVPGKDLEHVSGYSWTAFSLGKEYYIRDGLTVVVSPV